MTGSFFKIDIKTDGHSGDFSRKAISENTPKNTRKSMLANTLGDAGYVN